MTECILCQIIEGRVPSKVVYEDDKVMGVLDFMGAQLGHCFVFPKAHFTILEQVPDEEVGKVLEAANKVSQALFSALEIQGTNVFIANGVAAGQQVPHFFCHIIPRAENDGINLQWNPKQLGEEEMSTVELKIKEQIRDVVSVKKEGAKVEVKKQTFHAGSSESMLIRQIRRIP